MTKFCPKPMVYEGVQFKGIHYDDHGEYDVQFEFDLSKRLPRWLVNALMDGELYAAPDQDCLLAGITAIRGMISIYPEDWVMYKEDLGIFMLSNNKILEDFDVVYQDLEQEQHVIKGLGPHVPQDTVVLAAGVSATGKTWPNIEGVPV